MTMCCVHRLKSPPKEDVPNPSSASKVIRTLKYTIYTTPAEMLVPRLRNVSNRYIVSTWLGNCEYYAEEE